MNYEIIELKQGSPAWKTWRNSLITASIAPILMGVSPYSTPFKTWRRILGLDPDQQETESMAFGKASEPELLQYANSQGGYNFKPVCAVSKLWPFLGASLDGWDSGENMACELKCNNQINHATVMKGKCPDLHLPQLYHIMVVMDIPRMIYISKWMNDKKRIFVERDHVYINKMIEKERDFYQKLLDFEPPELTERDCVLRRDPQWRETCDLMLTAKRFKENWEKEEKKFKDKLIELANGQPCQGAGIRLQKIHNKGSIDYKAACTELKGIDLEQYRKPSSEFWKIITIGNDNG